MKPEHRCLVHVTSFCEYQFGKPAVPYWFALGDAVRYSFAGLWRPGTGTRAKTEGKHELSAFLTTEPNVVRSADPPEGDVRFAHHSRGVRCLADGPGGGTINATTAFAGCSAKGCGAPSSA